MTTEVAPAIEVAGGGGYRLHKLEICNWGTFDRHVFSVRPAGHTTLLVGQNGSGKSTLVDALLTLLVKPGVRNFNVAAGAKKTERDERSYLKGAYDRSGEDGEAGGDTRFLRPKGDHVSVILATFRNERSNKVFTVAQLLYLGADQKVEKVHCFSADERSIQHDFRDLGPADRLLRTLTQRGWQTTKTFVEYERWIVRTTRAKAKAMEVFNQTVAVKDIQRLNDFIRHHMLEAHAWSERVDRLLVHFTQLREAHQSLVRIREQFQALQPIADLGTQYRDQSNQVVAAELEKVASDAYFSQKALDLFVPRLENLTGELAQLQLRTKELAADLETVRDEQRRVQNDIEQAGGPRLREIPLLIRAEQAYAARKRQEQERFLDALRRSKLTLPHIDVLHFAALREQVIAARLTVTTAIRSDQEAAESRVGMRAEIRTTLREVKDELEGLEQRRDNLPAWCASLRQSLCADLGLPITDLPFVAELVAVLPNEREWESSIEMVLHSFALSLLVPDRLYRLVTEYIDRTRLIDGRGQGQRLRYLHVGVRHEEQRAFAPSRDSMVNKLEYRAGHALLPWVKAELHRQYDFQCCDSIEIFQRAQGRAMTKSRHVKSTDRRHDKNDRDDATDRRRFVLGWDNREKKKRLATELEQLIGRERAIQADIDRHNETVSIGQDRLAALDQIAATTEFSDIHVERHEAIIRDLQRERDAIEANSNTIGVLKQRLTLCQAREAALGEARDDTVREERSCEQHITQAQKLIANAKADLHRREQSGSLARDREAFEALELRVGAESLTVDTIFDRRETFRVNQDQLIARLRDSLEPLKNRLIDAMHRFAKTCADENDLRPTIEYLDGFLDLRRRIAEEDLPRHEQRFKERLNEKVIQEIGLFRGELDAERRAIEDKIDTLNLSLRQLQYRPATHIRLEARPVRDPEIVDFQTRLRQCIDGSFDDSDAGNEARFLKIQELLQRLQDENNRRWRDKVTDVRRWFDFVAAVVDNESGKTLSIYQDSSGQSGGEKAKLAFTILVAAIAYQYDLEPGQPDADRFQFVVVDEMFSKVDDQHAEYALDLFRQFGLQLLIVAPLDAKARVTQPYVGCYLYVDKRDSRSEIFEMTAREFETTLLHGQQRLGASSMGTIDVL